MEPRPILDTWRMTTNDHQINSISIAFSQRCSKCHQIHPLDKIIRRTRPRDSNGEPKGKLFNSRQLEPLLYPVVIRLVVFEGCCTFQWMSKSQRDLVGTELLWYTRPID